MTNYTKFFEDISEILTDDDDYIEKLEEIATLFRTFDKALDSFIINHGYVGDLADDSKKISFITDKLKEAGVPIPRNIKKWYSEQLRIERKTAFQICFAFGLDVDEVNDFLRRICLLRGFDCHDIKEVVYYFAFKNGLTYAEVSKILEQVEVIKPGKMDKEDIIYTDLITEEIDEIESIDELIVYLNENSNKFAYNNATAYENIRFLWEEIAKEDGLALREKEMLYVAFNKDEGEEFHKETLGKKRKERKRLDESIWEIYLQILGLAGSYADDIYKDRSIKSIIRDNKLLHPLAQDSFPDRDGLTKIINGVHVSYERVRKLMILLVFYRFWSKMALENNHYNAGYGDADRCIWAINDFLTEAGYPMLYPANPYDFIFYLSLNSATPLITFRDYMREMFFGKVDADGKIVI